MNKKKEKFIARIYPRDSSEKINAVFSIFLLLFIFFIVMNHYVTFVVVTSESMAPTFKKGDLVLVQSINKIPVKGDIIQFQVPSKKLPVLHRVHEVTATGYITKGDWNPSPDDWMIRESQIQAKVLIVFNSKVKIPALGEFFIAESRVTRFGSEFGFNSGVVNIIRIFAFIIFILALLSLVETII